MRFMAKLAHLMLLSHSLVLPALSFTSSRVAFISLGNQRLSRLVSSMSSSSTDSSCSEVDVAACEVPQDEEGAEPQLPPIAPMSKRLFLVRHGEVINPGGDRPVYYGAMDVPLSPLGEAEATAAAKYLEQFQLQHVACSPLKRAIFGANEVLSLQNKDTESDLVVNAGFTELDRGAWCGKTKAEIGANNMARFDACDESVTPDGGESYPALKARVLKARDELLEVTDAGKASALVSHLQVTRSMLSDALDIPTNEMAGLKVATASVTCIDYDEVGGTQTVHFQGFKPEAGLRQSNDGAN